jgi:hypothetical protein
MSSPQYGVQRYDLPICNLEQAMAEVMRRREMDGISSNRLELGRGSDPKAGMIEVLVKVTTVSPWRGH